MSLIIVTGGAGFIGSNLIQQLNQRGERNILLVDNFAPAANLSGPKFLNLHGAQFADYMDKREFRAALKSGEFENTKIRAILHQGACSNTLEDDGRYMMDNNFTYSKELLHFATDRKIPFVYASTAAVYGASTEFTEVPANERPLNVYGYSKLVFDDYVRRLTPQFKSTVVGLRYFNVYGPREQHKGRMASVIHHFTRQLKDTGTIRMFVGSGGYADGEQRRDFVYVKDLARINHVLRLPAPRQPKAPGPRRRQRRHRRSPHLQGRCQGSDGRPRGRQDRVHPVPRRPDESLPALHPGRPRRPARRRLHRALHLP